MLRNTCRAALAAALGTTLALGTGAASASASVSIDGIGDSAPIVQRLYAPVTLTITCDDQAFFGAASVTIRQRVPGKSVAHGTGTINSLTCDGIANDYAINVFPDTGTSAGGTDSPPFAKGDAVATAQIWSYFGPTVTMGPQPIKLTK